MPNPLPTTKRILVVERPSLMYLESCRMMIKPEDQPTVPVPIEDIAIVVLDYANGVLSLPLLSALADAEVMVLVSNEKHLPVAAFVPFAAHHQTARIARIQADMSEPVKKRIWQQIIQAKVRAQAAALEQFGISGRRLYAMAAKVQSGDPGNVEAVAAAYYFPELFGDEFDRDSEGVGINAMLNYGYALIRAAVARSLCGAGLHPVFGVHHHNRFNPYALADDAMEPLRPLVDARVKKFVLANPEPEELAPLHKRWLHPVLTVSCRFDGRRYPLMAALEFYAAALRRAALGEGRRVPCPIDFVWEE